MWKSRGDRSYEIDDIMLLKVGRHLRPRPHFKMIVGREDGENKFLQGYRKQYTHLITTSHNGPLVLIDGKIDEDDLELAAQITARFSQGRNADKVDVEIHTLDGNSLTRQVTPIAGEAIPRDWYL
jgi:predicted ribosome quality control (RQC) complex YloA/Tae2 family protein